MKARGYREDVNLLLNPKEMGELRHMHLDFENFHALIFSMPDHNLLLITLEKVEPNILRIVSFITRLLQSEGLIRAR